jgi:hypothetical protein
VPYQNEILHSRSARMGQPVCAPRAATQQFRNTVRGARALLRRPNDIGNADLFQFFYFDFELILFGYEVLLF